MYIALLLIQWAAEGHGQLISLLFNSNMQLAGSVLGMVAVVLTGSIPKLSTLPSFFTYLSFANFGRWAMQLLMGLEYYPWLASAPGFPPPPEPFNGTGPWQPGLECLWDHTPDCSQIEEDQALIDALNAALRAMNSSIGQLNCTQVAQCPLLYASLNNLTIGLEQLLHEPYEQLQEYEVLQELSKVGANAGNCHCFCGYAGVADEVCPHAWVGVVPYCNDTAPFDPRTGDTDRIVDLSNAVLTCSQLSQYGYELPYGPSPVLSRGPSEALTALFLLGLVTRFLTYIALRLLDRRKR